MRTLLAVLFMSLATQAFSEKHDYDFCQMDGDCEISSSENTEEVNKFSVDFDQPIEELYPPECEEVYWEAAKEAGKMSARYNSLGEKLLRSRQEISELKKQLKSDLTMMEIVAQKVGQEEAFSTTHAIVYSEFIKLSKKERIELQLVLKARGMYRSELDGTWGQFTSAAFAFYLAPKMKATSARTPAEFFSEIKKGFLIDELWRRENLEKDLQEIWQTDTRNKQEICRICSSGISSGSRSSSSSKKPDYSSIDDGYDDNSSSSTASCSSDFQCGFREKCVKRLGKSMCVKVVDSNERKVRDRNAEPKECRYDSQCPSGFECDKQFRICVVD